MKVYQTLYVGTKYLWKKARLGRLVGVPARYAVVVWLATVPPASSQVDPSTIFCREFPHGLNSPAILGLSQVTGSSLSVFAHFSAFPNPHPISPTGNLTNACLFVPAACACGEPVSRSAKQMLACDQKNPSSKTGCVHSHGLIEPADWQVPFSSHGVSV